MIKVITYGSYDKLHYGHKRLLERAKALGDYLIVAVTSDDFDKQRGKINIEQSVVERIKAVEDLHIADKIIIEEYEGQKIDDIKKYGVDIFTVGSDWEGKFDYISEYCKVVYLPRTEGVSSSEIRSAERHIKIGIVNTIDSTLVKKVHDECKFVNGIETVDIDDFNDIENVDAVYLNINHKNDYNVIKRLINKHIHILCESPITVDYNSYVELKDLALKNNVILADGIKTAYSLAYVRMILLVKSGIIGEIVSIDSTCTSLRNVNNFNINIINDCFTIWGPTALLPILQILGTDYENKNIFIRNIDKNNKFPVFVKMDFVYKNAAASIKVGDGVKSEGELIISGTKGYVYVPAPWWKTEYFEVRFEDSNKNKRYFYKSDGEGIRYELISFLNAIKYNKTHLLNINNEVGKAIVMLMEEIKNAK